MGFIGAATLRESQKKLFSVRCRIGQAKSDWPRRFSGGMEYDGDDAHDA
jgi:hypothetical protein